MEFLIEYAGFLLRLITLALIVGLVLSGIAGNKDKQKGGRLVITRLNDEMKKLSSEMRRHLLDKKAFKQLQKEEKKQEKAQQKAAKGQAERAKKNVFVLDFDGDIRASAVEHMRKEITALLSVAKPGDEVVLRLESGGGVVHGYGLAASQLQRIKDAGVTLTVCVDKVAASGGYMMACVADNLVAAPFAILGSIGVVAQVPNLHRLLDKNNIDVELHTAGKYKRTLTMLGENTEEGRAKFKQDLEDTHVLFKTFVSDQRPVLDVEEVANGDVWYGSEALTNKLIDKVETSDAYLLKQMDTAELFSVQYHERKKMAERLGMSALAAVEQKATKWFSWLTQHRGF